MTKKLSLVIIILVAILFTSAVFIKNIKSNQLTNDNQVSLSFSANALESPLSDDDMVKADAIVRGKVLRVKSRHDKVTEQLVYPVVVYEFEVIEDLSGLDKRAGGTIMEISLLDASNMLLDENETYLLFLRKHDGQDVYSPLSYLQAVYKEQSKGVFTSMAEHKTLNYDSFKQKLTQSIDLEN